MNDAEWKSKDKQQLRDWLMGLLEEQNVRVQFEKLDGSLRNMNCTLKDAPVVEKKTQAVRKPNEEVLVVFDVDLQEWRSFRLDSIKEVGFSL